MNDRAISILDNYDLQILRTWKGRGSILCETDQGIRILKEYNGSREKIYLEQKLLRTLKDNGFLFAEEILTNKEGEPYCVDADQTTYIVKSYIDGRECNIREEKEYLAAVRILAGLHSAMELPRLAGECNITRLPILFEFEKRNKELRRVRKYLKEKRQKTDFERYLQNGFDGFYEKALTVTEQLTTYPTQLWLQELKEDGTFCHGDYQYHNIILAGDEMHLINFEKFAVEDPVKDLYLFARKLLEKNNWDHSLGKSLIVEYEKERKLAVSSRIQLLYRFLYPEKFWKIVNYYYNNTKTFIPGRNKEKLDKIMAQESAKEAFTEQMLRSVAL